MMDDRVEEGQRPAGWRFGPLETAVRPRGAMTDTPRARERA
jgi:hypothetical protein